MISLMRVLRLPIKRVGVPLIAPLLLLFVSSSVEAVVYLKPKEVLSQFFKDSERVISVKKDITAKQRDELKKQLGYALSRDRVTFFVGKTGDRIDGYALLDSQIGKTQPITFMTLISPAGQVEQVELLIYRESHGSEVRHKSFLKQFYQKNIKDPMKPGRDIVNISGATISVRAVSIGVRRALVLWDYFFGTQSQ